MSIDGWHHTPGLVSDVQATAVAHVFIGIVQAHQDTNLQQMRQWHAASLSPNNSLDLTNRKIMHIDRLVGNRLLELIKRGEAIVGAHTATHFREKTVYRVSKSDALGWSTSVASLLQRAFGETSIHFKTFEAQRELGVSGYETDFIKLQAVLLAAKDDFDGGFLFTVKGLVKAEVLDDALEQAELLLAAGYKDPACVLVGVSLEVAVKELVQRAGIPAGKLDRMNTELCKVGTYNAAKQKQITAWADLRNKSAHGEWTAYVQADVEDMLSGVRRFVADHL